MTVISVSQLIPRQNISKHADEMLAFDALLFLASAMLSYFSIRNPRYADILERRADLVFLIAITLMVVIGFVVSFELLIN